LDWNWVLLIGGACLVLLEVALGGFAGFDMVLVGSAFMIGGAVGCGSTMRTWLRSWPGSCASPISAWAAAGFAAASSPSTLRASGAVLFMGRLVNPK
jgi:hypothetical protein